LPITNCSKQYFGFSSLPGSLLAALLVASSPSWALSPATLTWTSASAPKTLRADARKTCPKRSFTHAREAAGASMISWLPSRRASFNGANQTSKRLGPTADLSSSEICFQVFSELALVTSSVADFVLPAAGKAARADRLGKLAEGRACASVQVGLMPHLATKAFAGCAFSSQTAMLQRDHSTFGLSLNEADLPAKET